MPVLLSAAVREVGLQNTPPEEARERSKQPPLDRVGKVLPGNRTGGHRCGDGDRRQGTRWLLVLENDEAEVQVR